MPFKILFTALALSAIFVASSFISAVISEMRVSETIREAPEKIKNLEEFDEELVEIDETSPAPPTPTPKTPQFVIPDSTVHDAARKATVNILCTARRDRRITTVTGSGVFIDPRGVLITNAHVADYFLFEGRHDPFDEVECSIRQGSPAVFLYSARIIHLPPVWVEENLDIFSDDTPRGTGEHDYAFLLADLPQGTSAPYLMPKTDNEDLEKNMPVLIAGYPAGFFKKSKELVENLFVFSAVAHIVDLFTFTENFLDLISLEGSVIAQGGSSGGAVVDAKRQLIGIIGLTTSEETASDREIRALTLGHVERSLIELTGGGIMTLLSGNLSQKADIFEDKVAPSLRKILEDII